jgi:hypothetical protein
VGTVITLLVLAGIAGAIYYYFETQATKDVVKTTFPPSQIIRQAVQDIGSQRRYTATGHSSDFASFTFKQHANCGIAIVFAIFFVIPGILYFLIASRTQSLSINVFPEPDGTTSVQVSASGGETKRRGKRFLRSLPAASTVAAGRMQPALAGSASTSSTTPAPIPASRPAAELPTERETATPAFVTAPTATAEIVTSVSEETVYCQDCGAQMNASHKFCPACGTEQPAA